MSARPSQPEVVVAAADASVRAALRAALGAGVAVCEIALPAHGPLVDPAVLVAHVASADELGPLLGPPRAGPLVLVTSALDDGALARLLAESDAGAWLPYPPPPAALRRAVAAACAALPGGAGARAGQRRAPALLGVSTAIRSVIEEIRRIAPTTLPVLVLGETGTGKELVARALHAESPRADAPFVAVNCSALPDSLLESELFGFARGAFTGADRARRGLFEQADGGTLFLDEVGDTSAPLQAKLLRALEEKTVRPLGAERERPVDVRFVSATHRDLEADASRGAFRRDLLYRLHGAVIHVPPLRRRRVDIPFLAQHFAEELGEAQARRIVLGEDLLDALSAYGFPGNIRELRNAVERAIALTRPGEDVTAAHLHLGPAPAADAEGGTLRDQLDRLEAELLRSALQRFAGNRTRMAAALGLSRVGLREKMRRHGLAE